MEIVRTSVPLPVPGSVGVIASQSFLEKETTKYRVLIYDREDEACSVINECLGSREYDLTYCREALQVPELVRRGRLTENPVDLLLWGLSVPFESGPSSLMALQELRAANPGLRVVLLAPQEALAFAAAIKSANVEAFVLKPLHANDLLAGVDRALNRSSLSSARGPATISVVPMRETLIEAPPVDDGRELGLIGQSQEMRKVVSLIRRVGRSSVNVLVTGESGSGKEMVASAIHKCSDRAGKPFVAINCAAIPRELLESELFGHAKGAFTGATSARRGLFEEANEGTILLDEIGDLPLPLQAKILRLLQTRQVKPLGQNSIKEVDVRIISATHKNLKALIQKGEFREDLYYRLNVMPIHLPALRERKDDIILLAEHFLRRFAQRTHGAAPKLSRKACTKLLSLPWKGNVRELENVIERSIVLSDGVTIEENDIMCEEMESTHVTADDLFNAGMSLKDIEREYIKYVLNRTGNRKEAATRILGIDRKTLYRKEKLYGIRPSTDLN